MQVILWLTACLFLFGFAPFYLAGLAEKTKAIMAGRRGRPLFQPLHDLVKLLRKGEVRSTTASALSAWAPAASLAAVATAGLLLPLAGRRLLPGFAGDFVCFAYLLALSRFLLILNAWDKGSSFEAMGGARESVYGLLAEPILFILLGTISLLAGQASFDGWLKLFHNPTPFSLVAMLSGGFLLFILLLTEGCRVPFDDPNTHLELTMIHEVMILDDSGPDLAFLAYGGLLKMAVFASLIAAVFGVVRAPWPALAVYLISLSIVGVLIGLVEATMARLRLQNVPQLLLGASGLAFVLFVMALLGGG